ncbi:ATP-binding protein [Stenotrophomonas rhizophila]|jgi:SpoVK/Ycf46/Vps4 family AAA+-type ATPase
MKPTDGIPSPEARALHGHAPTAGSDEQSLPAVRTPRFKLDSDVVLAANTRLQLDECLARIRHHRTIYSDWGFAAVDPLGRSSVINFHGPPGTGKTMAAEALAGTLGIGFHHLGIAELESRFLGETARNIQAAFQIAHDTASLLFFDEADTLLGARLSNVTQGVDNEVNAMRSTLLIELERFEGIVVFASNFARNYDEAFRSRISYHIHFDLPDLVARRALWDRMIVPGIPLAESRAGLIENCAVASRTLSGREIRTCLRLALPKALLEAGGSPVHAKLRWSHLQQAIADVQRARQQVGRSSMPSAGESGSQAQAALDLLGV